MVSSKAGRGINDEVGRTDTDVGLKATATTKPYCARPTPLGTSENTVNHPYPREAHSGSSIPHTGFDLEFPCRYGAFAGWVSCAGAASSLDRPRGSKPGGSGNARAGSSPAASAAAVTASAIDP